MGNVTLPTPVAVAGGALCLLGGYLLGALTGPDTPSRTTAVVESYDRADGRLCLTGEAISAEAGADDEGRLCGTWRRSVGDRTLPAEGDEFRFVSVEVGRPPAGEEAEDDPLIVIYGDVVP